MPEPVVDFITSLDGYAAAEGWPGWWGLEGPEYLAWLDDHPERDHTVLMGANTYRVMSEIAAANADAPIFVAVAEMPKVVFSNTLTTPDLRRLRRRRPRHGRQPHLRRPDPAPRVRPPDPHGPTRRSCRYRRLSLRT
jgi:RibD C-terminal domain